RGYEVFLGDTSLGFVRDENVAMTLMKDFDNTLTNTYDLEISFEEDLDFEPVNIKDESLITTTKLNRNIRSEANFLASAFSVKIDGEQIGVVKSEEEAEAILDEIKDPFVSNTDENTTILDAEILQDVEITPAEVNINELNEKDEILEY